MLDPKLIEPKEVEIDGKHFILSKFDAINGRKIITIYDSLGFPLIDPTRYKESEEVMLELMKYVAVKVGDRLVTLSSRDLVNNHIWNWQFSLKVESEMIKYNSSFL